MTLNGCDWVKRTACRCDRVVNDLRESIDSCMVDRESMSDRDNAVLAAIDAVVALRRLGEWKEDTGCKQVGRKLNCHIVKRVRE